MEFMTALKLCPRESLVCDAYDWNNRDVFHPPQPLAMSSNLAVLTWAVCTWETGKQSSLCLLVLCPEEPARESRINTAGLKANTNNLRGKFKATLAHLQQ